MVGSLAAELPGSTEGMRLSQIGETLAGITCR